MNASDRDQLAVLPYADPAPGGAVRRWGVGQLLLICTLSLLLWAALALVCLLMGSSGFGWPTDHFIREQRLEQTLLASLIGAALAAAGVVYQAILRNPLAEPYLLGVSSGAALAAYIWSLFPTVIVNVVAAGAMRQALIAADVFSQETAAFVGAILALLFAFALSQRRGRLEPVTLLLVGVIVNAICGAAYLLVWHLNLRNDVSGASGGALQFLVGGINTNLTPMREYVTAGCVAVGWIVLFALTGQLNIATLSEAEAQSLGVRIQRLRWGAMIVASLITASAVAISGPIGFVGLVCPHLGRVMVGPDQRRLFPLATALGAGLLAVADAASRQLSPHTQGVLPVGVLTGMLGGPFFLFLLWQNRHRADMGKLTPVT